MNKESSKLFTPLNIRSLEFKNRIFVSPMCQYSANDGIPNNWHTVHLGTRAVGGASLVMAEASAIIPEGRITPHDAGIWNKEQVENWKPITEFIKEYDSIPSIQLAHAGRKASRDVPWRNGSRLDIEDWSVSAPSSIAFNEGYIQPSSLSIDEIDKLIFNWVKAAENALEAGFQVIELHFAHGYLVHSFLSPISNIREDDFGGSLENRARFGLEIVRAVRQTIPNDLPLFVRISASDWLPESSWNIEESLQFSIWLKENGVDLIDCSSGGLSPNQMLSSTDLVPGYQVEFAETIKNEAEILTGAVGLITDPEHAESILVENKADAIFIGRELLRNPYWPLSAALALGDDVTWPDQYLRSKLT